jgi:hypothetical protein
LFCYQIIIGSIIFADNENEHKIKRMVFYDI